MPLISGVPSVLVFSVCDGEVSPIWLFSHRSAGDGIIQTTPAVGRTTDVFLFGSSITFAGDPFGGLLIQC